MDYPEDKVTALFDTVLHIVRAHSDGISEHDLLRELGGAGVAGFEKERLFETELSLFQCHFLLFHVLYRLRDRLLERAQGDLRIHFLRIILLPYGSPHNVEGLPEPADDLRAYYLDLKNLNLTSGDVRDLLNAFWMRFSSHERGDQPSEPCLSALAVLGLDHTACFDQARQRYRRLVMEHHPDRGGDTHRLQEINAAMAVLRSELEG